MKSGKITIRASQGTNQIVKELSGYVELGMKRQALKLARRILAKQRVEPGEFTETINTLGTLGSSADLRKWREMVESAYARQSVKARQAMKGDMMRYYYSLKDWENALRFASTDEMKKAANAVFVMDLLLETKRMEEAKRLARNCERLLRRKHHRYIFALLIEALGAYYARVGEWDKALNLWRHAPLEEPFRQNALGGIVRIHLARALMSVSNGLQSLDLLKKTPDQETALMLPGNDDAMTRQAEKELIKYKGGIEKLLPVSRQMELGFCD